MPSVLVVGSATGRRLTARQVARASQPSGALPFVPREVRRWMPATGTAVATWWAPDDAAPVPSTDPAGGWTSVVGVPLPLGPRGDGDAPTDLRTSGNVAVRSAAAHADDPCEPAYRSIVEAMGGGFATVRIRPDGVGWAAIDSAGVGPLHIAERDGVVAVSDRPRLAALGVGLEPRADPAVARWLPTLGVVGGPRSGIAGVRTVLPGTWLRIDPRGVEVVADDPAWCLEPAGDPDGDLSEHVRWLVARVLAGSPAVSLLLTAAPGAATLLEAVTTALAATGDAPPVTVLAAGAPTDVVERARAAGLPVEPADGPTEPAALHTWIRDATARTDACVSLVRLLPPVRVAADEVVLTHAYGALWDPPGVTRTGALLRPEAVHAVDRWLDRWDRHHDAPLDADLARWFQLPRTAAARAAALAPATVVDVYQHLPAIRSARVGGPAPDAAAPDGPPPDDRADGGVAWPVLAPVAAAIAVRAEAPVDAATAVDLARGPSPPADLAALWGVVTAADWSAHGPTAVRTRTGRGRVVDRTVGRAQLLDRVVLVTGVTSRRPVSADELGVPAADRTHDPLLGVERDQRISAFVERALAAVGATPLTLPPGSGARLGSIDDPSLSAELHELLVARAGVLADPVAGLVAPFLRTQLPEADVVLVLERPLDVIARTAGTLPAAAAAGLWLDSVTAVLSATAGTGALRIVDLADLDPTVAEAAGGPGPDPGGGDPDAEVVAVATMVDHLVRELEPEALGPLLRLLQRGRAAEPPRARPAAADPDLAAWSGVHELRTEVATVRRHAEDVAARAAADRQRLEALRSRRTGRLLLRLFGADDTPADADAISPGAPAESGRRDG